MSWIIYFTANFLAGILDVLKVRQKNVILLIVSFNVLFVIGLRYKVGVDWVVYEDLYNGNTVNLPLEFGYTLLSSCFSMTGLGFWGFVFVITLFSLITFYKLFNTYTALSVFALTYYFSVSFPFQIDFLRQILAVSFSIWAVLFYTNGRHIRALSLIIIAISMHSSAAIFLLLPIINSSLFRKVAPWALMGGGALAVMEQYPVDWVIDFILAISTNPFLYKLKIYTTGTNISSTITFNLLFKLLIMCIYLYNRKDIVEYFVQLNRLYAFRVIIALFYFMLFIDVFLGKYGAIRLRLDEYLQPYFVLVLCYIITLPRNILIRQISTCLIIFYALMNIAKFTQDDYFKKQFNYSNSIPQVMFENKSLDMKRAREVKEHWAERNKVTIDE